MAKTGILNDVVRHRRYREGIWSLTGNVVNEIREGIALLKMAEAQREKSLTSVPRKMVAPFPMVSRHAFLTEEKAARFNVFLRVMSRDMELSEEAEEVVREAMTALRARFPRATSEDVSVPLEVMGA